jgi:putative copper resistance protein D
MQMGPGNMAPIRIDLHTLVRYWLVSPFTCAVLAILLLGAFWYFQASRDAAERGDGWPLTRTLAFFSGLVAVELAFQSSLAMLPYISFPIQVIQKLLLVLVAPPLLVLGAPLALAVETSSARTTDRLLRAVGSAPLRALTHPVVIFFLYSGGLLAYYLSSAVASSMRHVWLLNVCNVGFLLIAALFWWAGLGGEPARRPETASAVARLLSGAGLVVLLGLGGVLLTRSGTVAPIYTLRDTHAGGTVLLVGTVVALLVGLAAVATRWSSGWEEDPGFPDEEQETMAGDAGRAPATLRASPPQ